MKIKLALHRENAPNVDVIVTADATATVEDVARALADSTRIPPSVTPTLLVAPSGDEPVQLDPTALVGDALVGSGFDASVIAATADAYAGSGATAAVMQILNGPEAGRVVPLAHGTSIIGRVEPAQVVLRDPMVSKRHARIEISEEIELVDLNSANGLVVDGGVVPRVRARPGQVITVGGTDVTFALTPGQDEVERRRVFEQGGMLLFNRSPRVEKRYPGREHRHPIIPAEADPRIFPWPMVAAPVLLGFAMFALTQRPTSLLIVAMAPMMMLGNFIGQRTQQGKKLRLEIDTFERQLDELEDALLEEETLEREHRRQEAPPTATVYEQAMELGPLMWTRRPEHWNFLSLRLGTGTALSRNSVQEANDQRGIAEYSDKVNALRARFERISDVPLVELLPSAGAIGIAGGKAEVADVLRGIGVQIFGLHAPNEVITAAIVDPAWTADVEWMKWLPHTTSPQSPFAEIALADSPSAATVLLNALEGAVLERLSGPATRRGPLAGQDTSMELGKRVGERAAEEGTAGEVSLILFATNDAPVDRARLTQLIERGPDAGVYTIFVAPTVESLPAACRTFVDVTAGLDDAVVGWVRAGERAEKVTVEGVSREYAEHFAKRLAPVVDSSSVAPDSSDLPASVSLLRVIGSERASETSAVIERWRQNNSIIDRSRGQRPRLKRAGTLKAFMGQGSPDAMSLDLRTQGPHALVGGTTGSGKSEFLQTWVLGMAAEYSPDRVTFLYVDYKGGSAFADCVDLPHTVGLVTDLSPHLVRRALTSLRAELHHRERLFNRKKAKDLLELEKRQDPETPPALVIVIDEFAALATDVPEFVDGVVDIAQRGRSLGIHLIMATQRPAGVIKDNLRANTNLRVALRMADASDSNDVVGDDVASTFDPAIPGRGIAKTGPGRLVPFQAAYAGGWTTEQPDRAQIRVAELRFGSVTLWESDEERESGDTHDEDLGPNDQKRLVSNLVAAAVEASIPPPRRPWLDDLPTSVDLRDLPLDGGDGRIPLGLADIPQRQLQEAVYFEPDSDGHMLVYGTSGSGKSAALRSIGIAAGSRPGEGRVAVYGLDFGTASLRSIENMPHVGSIVSGDDAERVQRLLRNLRSLLDDRARRFSAVNASNLSEYRKLSGDAAEPRIVLLIDGFGVFKQDWETVSARASYYAIFMRILGEGRPLGVHVVATADRYGSVPTAVSANVSKRIVLRMSDESAYSILGVPKDVLNERSAPGRAIVDGLETQIAVIGGTPNVAEQNSAGEAFAQQLREAGAVEAENIGSLPTELDPLRLPDTAGGLPVLGIGEDTLGPKGFEPVGTFVVAGPPQSGKTTALRGIVSALARFDPAVRMFHIGGRRAVLRDYRPWQRVATGVEDVRALAKELKEVVADEALQGRLAIVIENLTEFGDTDAERPLKELFQAVNRSDHFLVADGDVSQFTSSYGLVGELKAARHGIALRPETYDGDSLFKVPFPKVQRHEFPPGRGLFVENGRVVTVQMPLLAE